MDVGVIRRLPGVGISGEVAASFLGLRIFSTPVIDYGSNIGFGNNFTAFLTYFGVVGSI